MKIVKMFGGVLVMSSLVYAGGDFQVITEYKNNDAVLAEEAYVSSYIDEPVVIVEEEYVEQPYVTVVNRKEDIYMEPIVENYEEQSYITVIDKEEDTYIEPTVEGYEEPIVIEEPMYITNSSNLDNAVNLYNASEHIQNVNGGESLSQKSVKTSSPRVNTVPNLNRRNGFYAGLGITALKYDTKCDCSNNSGKDTVVGGMTKVGYNLNRFVGVEARGMKVNLKNNMGNVKHAGLFLKPMLPLGPVANIYSLVGVAQTKTSGTIRKVDTKSLALGAGMEFGSGKGVGAFVDYERLVVKSGAPVFDTVSTGVSFGF